jgi:hypothetical protein
LPAESALPSPIVVEFGTVRHIGIDGRNSIVLGMPERAEMRTDRISEDSNPIPAPGIDQNWAVGNESPKLVYERFQVRKSGSCTISFSFNIYDRDASGETSRFSDFAHVVAGLLFSGMMVE